MCSPTTCRQCGKTTWTGCGQHVDSVKARVPAGQWCGGHETATETKVAAPGRSLFPWLKGR